MAVILQVIGFKNSGKTTLIRHFISKAKQKSYTVHAIKHDAHDFEIDHSGTDSHFFTEEGADAVLLASSQKYAIISQSKLSLKEAINRLGDADLTLVEGFKKAPFPKIILVRSPEEVDWFLQEVKQIVAFISIQPLQHEKVTYIGTEEARNAFLDGMMREFLE